MEFQFKATNFDYNKKTNCFVQEISILKHDFAIPGPPMEFKIINHKTKCSQLFKMVGIDKDGSNEDTYGWRYKSDQGINALIIND